jgi:H+-transporting ATPase
MDGVAHHRRSRGDYVEAGVVASLLIFNAVLGFIQEGRAQATPAPSDLVKLSLGSVAAADMRLTQGSILLDQTMLTGESLPIEAGGPGSEWFPRLPRQTRST